MTLTQWLMLLTALLLMGSGGAFIRRARDFQRLEEPGLRVVAKPIYDSQGKVMGTNSIAVPEQVLAYKSRPLPLEAIVVEALPHDPTYGPRLYTAPDGFELQMNAVLMGTDRTSIHKPQNCLTGQGWRIMQEDQIQIPITQPHPYQLPAMKMVVTREFTTSTGGKMTIHGIYIYWFVSKNQVSADHMERMLRMARDMVLSGVLQRWAYVSCFSVCPPGQEDATVRRMQEFIGAAVPQFQLAAGPPTAAAPGRKDPADFARP